MLWTNMVCFDIFSRFGLVREGSGRKRVQDSSVDDVVLGGGEKACRMHRSDPRYECYFVKRHLQRCLRKS